MSVETTGPAGPDMRFLSLDEVVERLPVSRRTLYKILDRGELRCVRIGKRRFVTESALAEYVSRAS